jgi:hypothetical protein
MDRLHVTRGYATPNQSGRHCLPHEIGQRGDGFDPALSKPLSLNLF